jgi:hypothetical protein
MNPFTKGHRRIAALAAAVAVLWPYTFSLAGSGTTFTLSNRTRHFLHARLNNESFVYIAPGGSAVLEVTAPTSVSANVRYSPGQDVKGRGERTVDIAATTTYSEGTTTCNSSSQGEDCSNTGPSATTAATPGRWDVLPEDLTSE